MEGTKDRRALVTRLMKLRHAALRSRELKRVRGEARELDGLLVSCLMVSWGMNNGSGKSGQDSNERLVTSLLTE